MGNDEKNGYNLFMTKKFYYLPVFILLCYSGLSQNILKGRVITEETKKPLSSASVYLNNTSLGVITDDKGSFVLRPIPSGKVTLVVSCIGYETYAKFIDPRDYSKEMTIILKPKPEELPGVVLVPLDPDGWRNWGKLFTDLFIGSSPNALQCRLENPDVIRFRHNTDNTLTAFAKKPILIMNYALGYEITYKLEEFSFDFSSGLLIQKGYALYKDLSVVHPKKAGRYEKERREVYQVSLMHFMRVFYLNALDSNGFVMHSLAKISNPEKDRAKLLFSHHKDSVLRDTVSVEVKRIMLPNGSQSLQKAVNTMDSAYFYKKMLKEPDSVISNQVIRSDSVGFAADSNIAGFYFPDSLEVVCTLNRASYMYNELSPDGKRQKFPVSQFVFMNKRPVYILRNGYYYDVYDLKVTGYWAWWETMANKLPYDYYPGNKESLSPPIRTINGIL
jgi:hypothetical protein